MQSIIILVIYIYIHVGIYTCDCQIDIEDVIIGTRVHVTMTTTVHHNLSWLYENKLQPYTKEALLYIFIAASGSAPAVLVGVVWYDHVWVVRFQKCGS